MDCTFEAHTQPLHLLRTHDSTVTRRPCENFAPCPHEVANFVITELQIRNHEIVQNVQSWAGKMWTPDFSFDSLYIRRIWGIVHSQII